MHTIFWWVRQVFLTLVSFFFLLFGIHILRAAYRLEDPAYFVMTFFASNLFILISATLMFGFVCRMVKAYRNPEKTKN